MSTTSSTRRRVTGAGRAASGRLVAISGGHPRAAVHEDPLDVFGRLRAREVEALTDRAAEALEQAELVSGLDSFGDRGQAQRVGEAQHGGDHGAVGVALSESGGEGAVDLDDVDG